jgi:16S rRNA (cytosine1402-N4)-methyltransferase
MSRGHESVLLHESIEGLQIIPDGVYVDGTFGRGGHAQAILDRLNENGRLIAFDKDLAAVSHAETYFKKDKRFCMIHDSFLTLESVAQQHNLLGKINGVLLDLGVSSPQLDDAERGFSFQKDGPLDMRMNREQTLDAATFVNRASVAEMTDIFKRFGEERFALRIARAIEKERAIEPIVTTLRLAEIVKAANPKWERHKHPATRVFQAIRIHVNHELDDLAAGLHAAVRVLAKGGRLAVISFHSLEDRVVKQFMKVEEQGVELPRGLPVSVDTHSRTFKRVGKAIKPSEAETETNPRARSAVLRIGEKLS